MSEPTYQWDNKPGLRAAPVQAEPEAVLTEQDKKRLEFVRGLYRKGALKERPDEPEDAITVRPSVVVTRRIKVNP